MPTQKSIEWVSCEKFFANAAHADELMKLMQETQGVAIDAATAEKRLRLMIEKAKGAPLDAAEEAIIKRTATRVEETARQIEISKEADRLGKGRFERLTPERKAAMGPIEMAYEKTIGTRVWDDWLMGKVWEKVPSNIRAQFILDPALIHKDSQMAFEFQRAGDRIIVQQALDLKRTLTGESLGQKFTPEESRYIFWKAQREALPVPAGTSEARLGQMHDAATTARGALDRMGEVAMVVIPEEARGALRDRVFFANKGRYMPWLYRKFYGADGMKVYNELASKFAKTAPTHSLGEAGGRFAGRKAEGPMPGYQLVEDPAAAALGYAQVGREAFEYRLFDDLANNVNSSRPTIDGEFKMKIPESPKYGALSGRFVSPEVYEQLRHSVEVKSNAAKYWDKSIGLWKSGKTVLNPASYVRNLIGGLTLNMAGTGRMIFDPRVWKSWWEAAGDFVRGKGYWKEAMEAGAIDRSFLTLDTRDAMKELHAILGHEEGKGGIFQALAGGVEKLTRWPRKVYNAIDAVNKLEIYGHFRKKGLSTIEAAAEAKKWGIDWERAGTAVRWANRFPLPFISYTALATPRLLEAAVKHPLAFAANGALVSGISAFAAKTWGWNDEDKRREGELLDKNKRASWMAGRSLMRVPYLKGQYVDLTYLMPWEALTFLHSVGEEGGVKQMVRDKLFGNPAWLAFESLQGVNLHTGQPLFRDTDPAGVKWNAIFKNAWKRLSPPPVGTSGSKLWDAVRGRPDYNGRVRGLAAVLADTGLGVSTVTRDYPKELDRIKKDIAQQKRELKTSIHRIKTDPTLSDSQKTGRIEDYRAELRELDAIQMPQLPR